LNKDSVNVKVDDRERSGAVFQALAGRLPDRFGSVRGVMNASREELAAVDGIGPETARRIDGTVSEPVPVYGPAACF
jgi:ERCC4-type nuclease